MTPTAAGGARSTSQNVKLLLFVHNAASLLSIRIAGTAPADKPHLSNAAEQTNTQFVTLQTSLRPKLTQALQIQEKRWSDALRRLAEHRAKHADVLTVPPLPREHLNAAPQTPVGAKIAKSEPMTRSGGDTCARQNRIWLDRDQKILQNMLKKVENENVIKMK